MLGQDITRGFPESRFEKNIEPRVKRDDGGYYIYTLSENVKVYLDDYYRFLEKTEKRALRELDDIDSKMTEVEFEQQELNSFYIANKKILEVVIKTVRSFYAEEKNFSVVMTPWCFGTVVLEKVEAFRDRISKGEIEEEDLTQYPYDIIRYIDEIYRKVLLDLFEFPNKAFAMRWQYSELLKRYSKALSNISTSLESVMMLVKSYGS